MIKRTRVIGLCVVAILATSAIGASSASAEHQGEFGRCVKVAAGSGGYANAGCTEVGGVKAFEWLPGVVNRNFKTVLRTGIPALRTVGGTEVTCKTEGGTGSFKSNNTTEVERVFEHFTGCESSPGVTCETGAAQGVIQTAPLEGRLGLITLGSLPPSNNRLGLELHAPAGSNFVEFSCGTTGAVSVEVVGSVLHKVPTGVMVITPAENFVASSSAEQNPDHFILPGGLVDEHILESSVNSGPFEETGQKFLERVYYEEKIEANPRFQ